MDDVSTSPLAPPTSQTEQRAQRQLRLESFYDGLTTVDAKLDPGTRQRFTEMVGMSGNGDEARAQAVNKAYLAYIQPQAREAIETQWPAVRQQMAQQLGINKPDVTDTELYGAIGKRVKAQQAERQMTHEMTSQIQLAALEGNGDWMKAYSDFAAQAHGKPGFDPAHAEIYRQMAEGAAKQVAQKAAIVGPVVKDVAQLLTEAKNDANPMDSEDKKARREATVDRLMTLEPTDRQLALQLAAGKVAREQPATERGGLEKAGESMARGVESMTQGLKNQTESLMAKLFAPGEVQDMLGERRQVLRELASAYDGTVDPIRGQNMVTQGLLNLSGMLPQLGVVANPIVGIPLLVASNQDQRQGQLEASGVPRGQAAAVGLAQGTIDTALNFISSNMVFGKLAGGSVGGMLADATKTADLLKPIAKIAAIETGTLSAVTIAQHVSPLVVQQLASELGAQLPGVDWGKEFDAFKHALPETIATLVPMVLLGTGMATFRDMKKLGPYTTDLNNLKAVGFSEEQAIKIAGIADPSERMATVAKEWGNRTAKTETQSEAIGELDSQAETKKSETAGTVTKNPDGTFKVEHPDGSLAFDKIQDPAEAQHLADSLAERDSDPAKALTDLSNALKSTETGEKPPSSEPSQSLGITPPGTGVVTGWVGKALARIKGIVGEVRGGPSFTAFKEVLNKWVGAGQLASLQIRRTSREIERAIPNPRVREGVTAWLQAGGDMKVLADWAKNSTMAAYKKGYEAALKLTPDQIKVAERLRDFYHDILTTLQAHGIVDQGVEHYVNQMWKRDIITPTGTKEAPITGGKLTQNLRNAKERTFGSYFEGEQAGFKPVTKDIAKLTAIYANEVSKVLSTRQLIKDLTTRKGSDGRPLAAPLGNRALATATPGEPAMIKPLAKEEDTLDYRTLDNPALSKWKWIGEHNGADAYLEGQLGLHPEIFAHMKAVLGKSIIKEWYDRPAGPLKTLFKDAVHGIDKLGQVTKGTMLGFFSPFHQVQEATHAIGHKINPFSDLPTLDPTDPNVRTAVSHGLMLAGDNEAMAHFQDAINDPNPLNRLPVIGDYAKQYGEWLFHEYIPRLKLKTWDAIRDRNAERYADDLAARRISQDEIDYLSAQQTNAAYGHLNYADLGRDPTLQHILRLTLLAPDFLEARGRFAGQAIKGLVGAKAGKEQLAAFALLAVTQWMTARILNKTLDDDWHMDEPFNVVVGNRRYTMRSVPEDMWKLFEDPRRFAMGRISPLIGKGVFQLGTGKNWRGERVSYTDTFTELATAWIPIAMRSAPGVRELTETDRSNPISPWEQFVGSLGIYISRSSPISEAYRLAGEYKKAQGIKEDTGTYPVSKFQQLRYALEDGDAERAKAAYEKLKADGTKKIGAAFHASLFHPFTGSKAMDEAFKQSLPEDQLALVKHAEASRQAIFDRFNLLLQQIENSTTNN